MDTLEHVVGGAVAAFTVPVSFVEWTTLRVEAPATPDPDVSADWSPIAITFKYDKTDYHWDGVQPVEGERYVYVFARRAYGHDEPALVESLHLQEDGTILAARLGVRRFGARPPALDGKDSPLGKDPAWEKLGKTMRFVRRWRGSRMAHYFFATRVPLTPRFVEKLRKNVVRWVPPVMFGNDDPLPRPATDPDDTTSYDTFGQLDPNLVRGYGPGSLQVPILDPLTVALNLHDLAFAATVERRDYLTTYEGQDEHKSARTRQRQEKLLLAYVMHAVLESYKKAPAGVRGRVDEFLHDYWAQVQYRLEQEDMWWRYLTHWLEAAPIDFVREASAEHGNDEVSSKIGPIPRFMKFFTVFITCLMGANAAAAGRDLLASIVADKKRWKWVHDLVLPELEEGENEDETAEVYQVPRKLFLVAFVGLNELVPTILHTWGTSEGMWRVLGSYSKTFHVRFFADGADITLRDPHASAKAFHDSMKKDLRIEVPHAEEIVEEWHECTEHRWTGPRLVAATIVEVIDFALSLHQFLQDRSLKKGFTLVRSMADTTVALTEFAELSGRAIFKTILKGGRFFGVVAGVIEAGVSFTEAWSAYKKLDRIGEGAGIITGVGAMVSSVAFGIGLAMTEVPSPLIIVGLALMIFGAVLSFFRDTPMETFMKNCTFGADADDVEVLDELPALKRDDFLGQLEILLHLICAFTIDRTSTSVEAAPDVRRAVFTMGWRPAGAYLAVTSEERWADRAEPYATETRVSFDDHGKPNGHFGAMKIQEMSQEGQLLVTAPRQRNIPDSDPGLVSIRYEARLTLDLAGQKFVVPKKDAIEHELVAADIRAAKAADRDFYHRPGDE